ncbi:MAG: two-component regulator propeller domain-containing protein [Gemmatimonadota bacterium]
MSPVAPARTRLVLSFALLAVCTLLSPVGSAAQDRIVRRIATEAGLASPTVFSLAQDSTGYLWIGTVAGLYRYDGSEIRRWAAEEVDGRVTSISVVAPGRIVVLEEAGSLWRLDEDGAVRVEGPDGRPSRDVADIARGAEGVLWLLRDDGSLWRHAAGAWGQVDPGASARREGPRRVFRRPGGGVELVTADGLWTIPPDGRPRHLADVNRVESVLSLPDGRRYLLSFYGDLHLLRGGTLRRVFGLEGRGVDLTVRGGSLWAAYDRYLVRLTSDAPPEIIGPDRIASGGPLLVDEEGSLWMGSFSGLYQFPEPETLLWADADGLPSAHTRLLARTGDTTWVSTWQGVGRVTADRSGWRADTLRRLYTRFALAVDAEGDLWAGTRGGLAEWRSGQGAALRVRDMAPFAIAGTAEGEALWIGTEGGLYRVGTVGFGPSADSAIHRVRGFPADETARVTAVHHDAGGRVWAAAGERICRARADDAVTDDEPGWRCWIVPGADHFNAFHESASGRMWAASPHAGILRLRNERWEPHPGMARFRSRSVLNLVPSPSGGVWVLGHGMLHRVVAGSGEPGGWRVVERLTRWHGLPGSGGRDLIEESDGTLWITTARGLARVPSSVRDRSPAARKLVLVEARTDDERLSPDSAVALPHDRNHVELRFSALTYRDPAAVRYQVRLGPDREWSEPLARPVMRWMDLRPGAYRAEVRASLDGVSWSPGTTLLSFEVLPPWYLELRWIVVFAAIGTLVLFLGYRLRVRRLVELERQRTRIAMDLHDELGAALGSIGIQAGILASGVEGNGRVRRLAREIGDTAEEVGTTLTDLVWSLDPRIATLAELAARLEERGRRLFSDGTQDFTARIPEAWPDRRIPAPVRRNVFLVGLEALQNAARHSGADSIVLSLAPVTTETWRLIVRDDGTGTPEDGDGSEASAAYTAGEEGLGLRSMLTRAEDIGATLRWESAPSGGTEVVLDFPLSGRKTAVERLLERLRAEP